ncbi:MAG: IS200/IS605 family transposase [Gemmataceae bacterium]|nr:IS200/IS605 family transposase [Gemmataceae bacterium]
MPQSLAALYVHLVFSTKSREPLIERWLEEDLYAIIGGLARGRGAVLLAAGGMPDHVHLLVSMPRTWAVADLVRDLKSNSCGWVHDTFPAKLSHFAWQEGYGAFSVSVSQLEVVKGYLAKQKTHHDIQSFQDEYRLLLDKHEIEYDERYVWD